MPPRGNDSFDFTPILTHYLFLFTTFLAVASSFFCFFLAPSFTTEFTGWVVHSVYFPMHRQRSRCVCDLVSQEKYPCTDSSPSSLPVKVFTFNYLWFAIFLQLFLILGVLFTLATDSIAMHRFQISIFGAIAIVFAVQGVTDGIFVSYGPLNAMGAGWLILAIVDVLWVLYFTSEEDSLALHIFNMLGTGGLTPPSRRRRTRTQSSMHNIQPGGYATNYASGGIGSQDFEGKPGSAGFGTPNPSALRNQNSFGGSLTDNMKAFTSTTGGPGSIHNSITGGPTGSIADKDNAQNSPLMAGVGAASLSVASPANADGAAQLDTYLYKAKAMYGCTLNLFSSVCHD